MMSRPFGHFAPGRHGPFRHSATEAQRLLGLSHNQVVASASFLGPLERKVRREMSVVAEEPLAVRLVVRAVIAVGLAYLAVYLWCVALRIGFPWDLEWMEGG